MDKIIFGLPILGAWIGIGMALGMVLGPAIKKHQTTPTQGEEDDQ